MMPGTVHTGRDILLSVFPPGDPRHRRTRTGTSVGLYLKKRLTAAALAGHLMVSDTGDLTSQHPIPEPLFDYALAWIDGRWVLIFDSILRFFPINGCGPNRTITPPHPRVVDTPQGSIGPRPLSRSSQPTC